MSPCLFSGRDPTPICPWDGDVSRTLKPPSTVTARPRWTHVTVRGCQDVFSPGGSASFSSGQRPSWPADAETRESLGPDTDVELTLWRSFHSPGRRARGGVGLGRRPPKCRPDLTSATTWARPSRLSVRAGAALLSASWQQPGGGSRGRGERVFKHKRETVAEAPELCNNLASRSEA